MALTKRRATTALAGIMAISGFSGCCSDGKCFVRDGARPAKDALARADDAARPNVVRSQVPEMLPPVRIGQPTADPPGRAVVADPVNVGGPAVVEPASGRAAAPAVEEGDTQVRIVASIGNAPIYESEVREAVYQRLGDLLKLGDRERAAKQKEMFKEELRRIIERELVLDEMVSTLTARKQTAALTKLKESAGKEADAMLKAFKAERGVKADEEFRAVLRAQGLTMAGIRRQIERGTMMRIYMQEKVSGRMDTVSLADVRDYYTAHGDDFQAEDAVKWQDLFVMTGKFPTPAAAKQYAQQLHAQIEKGADLGPLAVKYGHGDSALRDGAGIGEKPGDIFPPELEPAVLRVKAGQSMIQETETGFHIIKVTERTVAGRRPLDEKLQAVIKKKVQAQIYEREAKRYVDSLWKKSQPQVWVEL